MNSYELQNIRSKLPVLQDGKPRKVLADRVDNTARTAKQTKGVARGQSKINLYKANGSLVPIPVGSVAASENAKYLDTSPEELNVMKDRTEAYTMSLKVKAAEDDAVMWRKRYQDERDANAKLVEPLQRKIYDLNEKLCSSREEALQERSQLMKSCEQDAIELKNRLETELEAKFAQILEHKISSLKLSYDQQVFELNQSYTENAQNLQQRQQQLENEYKEQMANVSAQKSALNMEIDRLQKTVESCQETIGAQRNQIESLNGELRVKSMSHQESQEIMNNLNLRIQELENLVEQKDQQREQMHLEMVRAYEIRDEYKAKLLKEETVRRKLHNQVQELKGNIRVMCRVRQCLPNESSEPVAKLAFPDKDDEAQQMLVSTSSKVLSFNFDRVFVPNATNNEIFDEISQLVQSSLDGYNVCIFAYGQTGSGKTYTMSSDDGMIPRAVSQIFESAASLREHGWIYQVTGQFVEIYNEEFHDLLAGNNGTTPNGTPNGTPNSPASIGTPKLEVKHDVKTRKTCIPGLTSVVLDSPQRVDAVLRLATRNRSVAATAMNERSSRSHSVFILQIKGENKITGASCWGTLNLIDLAGSERLSQSQAVGDRLKETQAINKSLSALGDVIHALNTPAKDSTKEQHVPYRNSKLTYLLQYSLSGNSKTLMFANVSPLEKHVNESISSLRFATKVNSTRIKR